MFTKYIRKKFLQYHPDEDLKTWFDPLVLNYADPDAALPDLTVEFPHRLFAFWWGDRYRDKFEHSLISCLGCKPEITYRCPAGALQPYSSHTRRNSSTEMIQGIDQDASGLALPSDARQTGSMETDEKEPKQTFANFIFNRKNQFPVAAAQNFTKNRDQSLLILFGPGGSGKSHLLHAIYNDIKLNVYEKVIILNNLIELETFLAKAFKNAQSILYYLRNFTCILIEDLDMSESRPDLQEQLVTLLEAAAKSGIKIALTIKQSPGALALINEKLRFRLESGLIIELKKPDLDVRRQYVDYLAGRFKLQLKKDDALAISRIYNGFHQIYGALLKVSSFLILSPQAAEAKLADILQSGQPEGQKRLTPDHIIASVAEYFKLTPGEITGRKRKQNIVFARHLSMYFCRELLGAQLVHIGACFSDMDHSSVLYSINKISKMLKHNKDTHKLVTEIKNIISK